MIALWRRAHLFWQWRLLCWTLALMIPDGNTLVVRSLGALEEGAICDADGATGCCAEPLVCQCVALNRGLRACMHPDTIQVPRYALKFERQGLACEVELPMGANPMAAPPFVPSDGAVLDPSQHAELADWAHGPGQNFYKHYVLVHAEGDVSRGIPVLAGADVEEGEVRQVADTLEHLVLRALVSDATLEALARTGVRVLVAGTPEDSWIQHPEVSREFTTGLGGGAPWFPSTGVHVDEPPNALAEELFHTIQYVAMKPRDVCMYHKAYANAMAKRLYTTDNSGPEVEGEPVPTVQADEYMAMALQRWLGVDTGSKEYSVPGNEAEEGGATGRENLLHMDQNAFCLLAQVFRSDDTWNPENDASPWSSNPNRGISRDTTETVCPPVLTDLAKGCPAESAEWPVDGWPRRIP